MRKKVTTLVETLKKENLTLALAESMTCGLAAHQLSTVKGTADVFRGSLVCYHQDVKTELLSLKTSFIEKYSPESAEVTKALTKNLKKLISADVYASVTGLCSAGGSETKSKPVGTVFYSVLFRNKYYSFRKKFQGSPLQIRKKATENLYSYLIDLVKRKGNKKGG